MEDFEQKLEAILGNPQMMQQIAALAGSMGGTGENTTPNLPEGLPSLGMDKNQRALLGALKPYLKEEKLGRLERAMQAAAMADTVVGLLQNGGLNALLGGAGNV